jgi:cysteine desulfurase
MGLDTDAAIGSLRFSLGQSTTEADIDYVIATLPALIARLREVAPCEALAA